MSNRDHVVSVRLSDAEYDALKVGADRYGMTLSAFLRGVALVDDAVPAIDLTEEDIPQYAKDVLYGYHEGYRAAKRDLTAATESH